MNTQRIGDRIVINIFSVFFAAQQYIDRRIVVGMLLAFIISCLGAYIKKKCWMYAGIALYFLVSLPFPVLALFYPVVLYEIFSMGQERGNGVFSIAAVLTALVRMGMCLNIFRLSILAGGLFGIGLAYWLNRNCCQMESVQARYFRTQDSSIEVARELKRENRYLLEKQDNDIYTATLRERNRIAREIHDNVGHMLSRGILMTGALLATAQEETVRSGLSGIKDCLDEAMTSIRQSVHNLHDDSLDLKQGMEKLFRDLSGFRVDFEYDMSRDAPREIKYCLLAIAKEAVSNTIRHSSGDRIEVVVQEHPAFYRMSVVDNGVCDRRKRTDGLGLHNIRERVEQLSGTLHIAPERTGFYIHVSIPKTEA